MIEAQALTDAHQVAEVGRFARVAPTRSEPVLFAMYTGKPEPPTLNAILVLKKHFGKIVFLRNNLVYPSSGYPDPPNLVEIGAPCETQEFMRWSTIRKFSRFARFCLALRNELARGHYRLVVLHDYLALLAFSLVRKAAHFDGLVWFNSYDAIDLQNGRPARFSLMGWVAARHEALFAGVDFFSLPSEERMEFYPIKSVKRQTFVIPNYPAISVYSRFRGMRDTKTEQSIKLIYQGALGRGHGFEEIIRILRSPLLGKKLELILKGWIDEPYRQELTQLAESHRVTEQLRFVGFGSYYPDVPALASDCTVGLAIYTGQDLMNRTLAKASNKIYEYAAVGLPVILFDRPEFRPHLGHREWAFFTDLSERSLRQTIVNILSRYDTASAAAIRDFHQEFNFESVFEPALRGVTTALAEQQHGR